jgi:short-subunit dehydrogenase
MNVQGRTVAVTGATGGIGRELCSMLVEHGASVLALCRSQAPSGTTHLPCDLSTVEGCDDAASRLTAAAPDVLIHLAGLQYAGPAEGQDAASLAALLHVNLYAPMRLSQAVLPHFRKSTGALVFVSSSFGAIPFPHFSAYSATKAGIQAYAEALRRELPPEVVPVIHIAPRGVDTAMNGTAAREIMKLSGSRMDTPKAVAGQILQALRRETPETYIGFPESLFVRLNALLPRVVDRALRKNVPAARALFTNP